MMKQGRSFGSSPEFVRTAEQCCLLQCGTTSDHLPVANRALTRVTLSVSEVYHPMGSLAVNCCLSFYQLSFLVERKLQRIAAQGRTYGSP